MFFNNLKSIAIGAVLAVLTACGGVTEKRDSAPNTIPGDLTTIPDAVPRDEPRSKYGNPSSYVVFGKRYYTLASASGYHEKGIASWYGTKFHGRRTSSGEPYDMYAMTAAHKTLPLPSYVEVTNLTNGRKVVVRVNDRGPFHQGRIIDLSFAAATKLGITSRGTGLVEVRTVNSQSDLQVASRNNAPTRFTDVEKAVGLFLQVGTFSTVVRAEQLKLKLQQQLSEQIHIMPFNKSDGWLYRVRIGPLSNVEQGDELASRLLNLGLNDSHVVVE